MNPQLAAAAAAAAAAQPASAWDLRSRRKQSLQMMLLPSSLLLLFGMCLLPAVRFSPTILYLIHSREGLIRPLGSFDCPMVLLHSQVGSVYKDTSHSKMWLLHRQFSETVPEQLEGLLLQSQCLTVRRSKA